jgi:hypothetical protein
MVTSISPIAFSSQGTACFVGVITSPVITSGISWNNAIRSISVISSSSFSSSIPIRYEKNVIIYECAKTETG